MFPTIDFYAFKISSYVLFPIIGYVFAMVVFCVRARHYRILLKHAVVFGLFFCIFGVLATKGMFALVYLPDSLDMLSVSTGADSWGVVFTFPLLVFAFSKLTELSCDKALDCFVPGLYIAFVFAQIACYLNGCCFGVLYGNERVPIQMIEACAGFCLFLFLLYRDERYKNNGKLYPLALVVHGYYRFLADFFRVSEKDWLYLSRGQWIALIAIVMGGIWLYVLRRKDMQYE